MFTLKLIAHSISTDDSIPGPMADMSIRQATAIHVKSANGNHTLQLGDAPGETTEVTVGPSIQCSYKTAFIMNSIGKTVEIIR
jgi:hypothetical protein